MVVFSNQPPSWTRRCNGKSWGLLEMWRFQGPVYGRWKLSGQWRRDKEKNKNVLTSGLLMAELASGARRQNWKDRPQCP